MTDATVSAGTSRTSTAFCLLVALILIVPGYFVGALGAFVYMFISEFGIRYAGAGGGSWIPFLDGLFAIVWFMFLPDLIRGAVAVGAALWVSFWLFKRANHEVVGFALAAVLLLIVVGFSVLAVMAAGLDIRLFGMVGLGVGVVVGAALAMSQPA